MGNVPPRGPAPHGLTFHCCARRRREKGPDAPAAAGPRDEEPPRPRDCSLRGPLLGAAVAGAAAAGVYATAAAARPSARRTAAVMLAVAIPTAAALDSALPIVRRKIAEAEEEERGPLPPGPVTLSAWYNASVMLRVMGWAMEDWELWGATYAALVFHAVAASNLPIATSGALQSLVTPGAPIAPALWRLTGLVLASAGLSALKGVATQEAQTRLVVRIQRRAIANVLRQEAAFFDDTTTTAIFTELSHAGALKLIAAELVPAALGLVVRVGWASAVLARSDVTLAAVCLLSVPADHLVAQWQADLSKHYSTEAQDAMVECKHLIFELVEGVKTLRPLNGMAPRFERFWSTNERLFRLLRRRALQIAGASIVNTAVPHLASLFIFGYAGLLARGGRLAPGDLLTVALYQASLLGAFSTLTTTYGQYAVLMTRCTRGLRLLRREPKQRPRGSVRPQDGPSAVPWTGDVEFRDVAFRYDEDKPWVLRDFSLHVRAGECVALVGASGAGKTTALSLLLGLYDPTEGEVLVDGRPVSDYAWYYGRGVAVVPQGPVLLQGSVRDNIVLGVGADVTEEEVLAAAAQANVTEFLPQLPGGLDAEVGKGGERLSGGQRQRVAIARALVRRPGVLVLDEATSALDAESEFLVQEAVHRAMDGRTVVVVAHRLSTVKKASRIAVLDGGRVVEEGDYRSLLAADGSFARLVRSQLLDAPGPP